MVLAGPLVFAGKTVAAAVMKEIVNKAFSYLNSYFGVQTMAELKRKLDRGLPKIQAVLDIISPDQVKDKSAALDTWFWQLRDAVEKAEDAIDEIELREAVEDLDEAAAGVADFLALADHLKGHTGPQGDDFLNSDRETGSMLTTTEVLGRHQEKELVAE
ncbi:hypothetical protein PR202_ga03750 [Eleusine coracana subsp. coracana]|uniref:Disease resistance N-terminal domain-containing protein n=1 Tax=Eleusine coracana subsp. coracana TaxID=191504 RepID=A0AAV5BPT6_ELECO|nr:hypothetical protein PR202_ga03750 [Eleusine coracana subsp. coracana]